VHAWYGELTPSLSSGAVHVEVGGQLPMRRGSQTHAGQFVVESGTHFIPEL
jgi:hypothetical protein